MNKLAVAFFFFTVAACSNQSLYNTVQHNQTLECEKLPQNQYEECMAEISNSYESYSTERDAIVSDEK